MDPCECIGQEFAVRRLLSLLRQTQVYCTDTQCLDGLSRPENEESANNLLFVTVIMAIAMIVYILRPRSSRRYAQDQKVINNNQGPQPPPDAPIN